MSRLPSVDRLLNASADLIARYGRIATANAIRMVLDGHRARRDFDVGLDDIIAQTATVLANRAAPSLQRMFNLTGTVLHTNLGRAPLAEAAIAHAAMAMRHPCNLEFDLADGGRGDRDTLVEDLLIELTGAEAATVVNNNAAAVLLVLAALARGREVIVSRGELIEIGGSFRIPDVMRSAGAKLVEVGTTNRTHLRDYEGAIGSKTALLMKVHASNYAITGFTSAVSERDLARLAQAHDRPLVADLGAGSLIDLAAHGLPPEPVVRDMIAAGSDIVMFSGDKLLGGPQAGLIVGRKDLIARIRKHPMKRALRLSKIMLAALEATLRLYRMPDLLARDLPALRLLTRPVAELEGMAARLLPDLSVALPHWQVEVVPVFGQVGSGSLPVDTIPSIALSCTPNKPSGRALDHLAARLRGLPVPVIGRIAGGRLLLDLRCLEDEACFAAQLKELA